MRVRVLSAHAGAHVYSCMASQLATIRIREASRILIVAGLPLLEAVCERMNELTRGRKQGAIINNRDMSRGPNAERVG